MKTILLTPFEHQILETFKTGFDGKILKNKEASDVYIKYPLEIKLDNKRAQVLISASISKKCFNSFDDYLKIAYYQSEKALLDYFKNLKSFNVFSEITIYVSKNDVEIPAEKLNNKYFRKDPIELNVSEELYTDIEKSLNEYHKINNIMKFVIDELEDYAFNLTSFGHSHYESKIINYLNFLEYSYDLSFSFIQHHKSLLYDIRRATIDLAKRKRENNFNYQYQKTSMKNGTFLLHPPDIWISKPVIPDEIMENFKIRNT